MSAGDSGSADAAPTTGGSAAASSVPAAREGLGARPISAEHPAGQPLPADGELDALRSEVNRSALHGSGPSWPRIAEISTRVLSAQSKDFTVASYLAVALAHTDQLRGLHEGTQLLLELCTAHWERGFPALPGGERARSLQLGWFAERCAALATGWTLQAADRELLAQCAQASAELDKLASERMPRRQTPIAVLGAALRELAQRLTAEPPAQQSGGAAQPQSAPAPVRAVPARPAPAGSASDLLIRSRSDVPLVLRRCGEYLREKHAGHPLGYRLQRVARWAELEAEPLASERRIPDARPPAAEDAAALRAHAERSNWSALLGAAEELFWEFPLWLDLQRWSHRALEALGSEHRAAALGVEEDVRGLLQRAPGLPRLCFRDGTPLAEPATERWIEQRIRPRASAAAAPALPSAAAPAAESLAAHSGAARALADGGDVPGALALLESAAAAARGGRERFLARLELAALCSELGRERLALALLEELGARLQRHELADWEPELAARALASAYRCAQSLAARGEPPAGSAPAQRWFEQLARIDPAAAAALE